MYTPALSDVETAFTWIAALRLFWAAMYSPYFKTSYFNLYQVRVPIRLLVLLLLKKDRNLELRIWLFDRNASFILVPRVHDPSGLWQGSRALEPIFWAWAQYSFRILNQSDLLDLTGSRWIVNFRCWTRQEPSIPATGQKDRGLWGRVRCKILIADKFRVAVIFGQLKNAWNSKWSKTKRAFRHITTM